MKRGSLPMNFHFKKKMKMGLSEYLFVCYLILSLNFVVILSQSGSNWCTDSPQIGESPISINCDILRLNRQIDGSFSKQVVFFRTFARRNEAISNCQGLGAALFHPDQFEIGEYPSLNQFFGLQKQRFSLTAANMWTAVEAIFFQWNINNPNDKLIIDSATIFSNVGMLRFSTQNDPQDTLRISRTSNRNALLPYACLSHSSCSVGFGGSDCDVPICFGELAGSNAVCSGHGVCVSPNICRCTGEFTGTRCDSPKCSIPMTLNISSHEDGLLKVSQENPSITRVSLVPLKNVDFEVYEFQPDQNGSGFEWVLDAKIFPDASSYFFTFILRLVGDSTSQVIVSPAMFSEIPKLIYADSCTLNSESCIGEMVFEENRNTYGVSEINANYNLVAFSIWFKVENSDAPRTIFFKNEYIHTFVSGNTLYIKACSLNSVELNTQITINRWTHIYQVSGIKNLDDGNALVIKLFVDGIKVIEFEDMRNQCGSMANPFYLGATSSSQSPNRMVGSLMEFALWNHDPSEQEEENFVQQLMQSPKDLKELSQYYVSFPSETNIFISPKKSAQGTRIIVEDPNFESNSNSAYPSCYCEPGFSGRNCEIPEVKTCAGVNSSDHLNVCNGRGDCIDFDTCSCEPPFVGTFCDEIQLPGTNTSFKLFLEETTWISAAEKCHNQYRGNLASFSNIDVMDFILDHLQPSSLPNGYWIGLTARPDWMWVTGEALRFSKWNQTFDIVSIYDSCAFQLTSGGDTYWYPINNCTTLPTIKRPFLCMRSTCNGKEQIDTDTCSGNGVCNSLSTCECNDNWSGDNCEIHLCFGLEYHNNSVCSGRGLCSSANHCDCDSGYAGDVCEKWKCNNVLMTNLSVCSSHGKCTGLDICDCHDGYFGSWCEKPICFGENGTYACGGSGRGSCVAPDTCSCISNSYIGENCEFHRCFQAFSNDSDNVCHGHGLCSSLDHCDCFTGYSGQDCRHSECFGIPDYQSEACSGNGICSEPNKCVCLQGFFGDRCQYQEEGTTTCYGIMSNSTSVCSNKGLCVGNNNCSCYEGFVGPQCEIPICFGVLSTSGHVCSSSGICEYNNTCSCYVGRYGEECEIYSCFGVQYDDPGVCHGNGICISTDLCYCNDTGYNRDCSKPICWDRESSDPLVCNGFGECISPNLCKCKPGRFGSSCQHTSCFGRHSSDEKVCSSHGNCIDHNMCQCSVGYSGAECETPICYGIPATNQETVCNGRGVCVDYNICSCNSRNESGFWIGEDCSQCQIGFQGSMCNERTCNGSETCNGRGECKQPENICTCIEGYAGHFCERCEIGFFGEDCDVYCNSEESCNNHGTCNSEGKCQCYKDFQNGFFNESHNCERCMEGYFGDSCLTAVLSDSFIFSETADFLQGEFILENYSPNIIECNAILHTDTLRLLGERPRCEWIPLPGCDIKKHFKITFGAFAKIVPGDDLLFNVAGNRNESSETNHSGYHRVITSAPSDISKVIVTPVINGPKTIGLCDGITLDATGSYSSDRRSLKFTWRMVQGFLVHSINNYISSINSRNDVALLRIPREYLDAGFDYVVELEVENFLGIKSGLQFMFTKSNIGVPLAIIRGPNVQLTTSSGHFRLEGRLQASACVPRPEDVVYVWRQISGTHVNAQQIEGYFVFPPHTFPSFDEPKDYQFEFSVHMRSNPNVKSVRTVTVRVRPQNLSVFIVGGNRIVSKNFDLEVVADAIDPDKSKSKENFLWYCSSETGGFCSFERYLDLSQQKGPVIKIQKKYLSTGSYIFNVIFSKGKRSTESKTVKVEVVENDPPFVKIETASLIINREERLVLRALVYSSSNQSMLLRSSDIRYDWSSNLKLPQESILTSTEHPNFVIAPNTLSSGESYLFSVRATTIDGSMGFASTDIRVNHPPLPGYFEVTPKNGVSLQTRFTLQCSQFVDEDVPLVYNFFYFDEVRNREVAISRYSQSNHLFVRSLPRGYGDDYHLKLIARVSDRYGATTTLETTIYVQPFDIESSTRFEGEGKSSSPLSISEIAQTILRIARRSINEVKEERDSSSTTQVTASVASLLNLYNPVDAVEQEGVSNVRNITRQKQELRYQMLQTFMQIRKIEAESDIFTTDDSVQQISSTIEIITSDSKEVSSETQKLALESINTVIDKASDENTLQSVANVISNVASAMSLEAGLNDSLTDAGRGMYYDRSPERIEFKERSKLVVESVERVWGQMIKGKIAGERPSLIRTKEISLVAFKEFGYSLNGKQLQIPPKDSSINTMIQLPTVLSEQSTMGENQPLFAENEEIEVKLNVYEGNPFLWVENSENVTSQVISLSLEKNGQSIEVRNLSNPFNLTIRGDFEPLKYLNISSLEEGDRVTCRYFSNGENTWKTDGCELVSVSNDHIICSCNHMTDFASFIEHAIPEMNILEVQDLGLITTLNEDNMTTLIVMCSFLVFYLLAMSLLNTIDLIKLVKRRKLVSDNETNLEKILYEGKKSKIGPARDLIEKFKRSSPWVATIILPIQQKHFSRQQRLTVLYIIILGVLTSSALMYGTEQNGSEVQWIVGSIVSSLVSTPFVLLFSFLFLKTSPRRRKELNVETRGLRKKAFDGISPVKDKPSKVAGDSESPKSTKSGGSIEYNTTVSPKVDIPKKIKARRKRRIQTSGENAVQLQSEAIKQNQNLGDTSCLQSWHDRLLDRADSLAEKTGECMEIFKNTKVVGVLTCVLFTIAYIAFVAVLVLFLLPKSFTFLTDIHMWVISSFLIVAYIALYEVLYIRIKLEKLKKGIASPVSKFQIIFFSILSAFVLMVVAGLSIAIMMMREDDVKELRNRLIIINSSLCGLIFCIGIWIVVLLKQPKRNIKVKGRSELRKEGSPRSASVTFIMMISKIREAIAAVFEFFTQKHWFPWWFVYFFYLLSYIFILGNSYILVIYGIKFDANRQAQNWLWTSFTGLLQDALVKSPLQFLLRVLILSTIVKFMEYIFFPSLEQSKEDEEKEINQQKQKVIGSHYKSPVNALKTQIHSPAPQSPDVLTNSSQFSQFEMDNTLLDSSTHQNSSTKSENSLQLADDQILIHTGEENSVSSSCTTEISPKKNNEELSLQNVE